ncbi:hypothetical protein AA106555_0448 [Neokomagataea thailandica NBRC 106555]|uniref:Uncharacterized protein n=1 Tax=Neokomagataea thailandica NBRC 106555 TaxID=1223520 RepID=A0ABQ0QN55_9PROT|nr:hypothetical protein AA106555_0448 [Neokomagataea thailandica NBRC 106555]
MTWGIWEAATVTPTLAIAVRKAKEKLIARAANNRKGRLISVNKFPGATGTK